MGIRMLRCWQFDARESEGVDRCVEDSKSVFPVEGGPTNLAGINSLSDCQTALHAFVVS